MALITATQVKAFLKITTNDIDTAIGNWITEAQDQVENYCGTTLESSTKTAYFGGNGLTKRYLGKLRVASVTTLYYRVAPNDTWITATAGTYSLYEEDGLYWLYYEDSFIPGYQYKLVYVSGYSAAQYDLNSVLIEMVATKYRDSRYGQNTLGQSTATVNIQGVNTVTSYNDLWQSSWKKRLQKYRIIPA